MSSSGAAGQVGSEHGQAGASKRGGGERVESDVAEHCDGIAADEHPSRMSTELFVSDREEDRVLLDWLRERFEHARCSALLQHNMERAGKYQKSSDVSIGQGARHDQNDAGAC